MTMVCGLPVRYAKVWIIDGPYGFAFKTRGILFNRLLFRSWIPVFQQLDIQQKALND